MTEIEQAIKALEPFAGAHKRWLDGEIDVLCDVPMDAVTFAGETYAALRQHQERQERGFKEWWLREGVQHGLGPNQYWPTYARELARAAYHAGQLAAIPAEIRET